MAPIGSTVLRLIGKLPIGLLHLLSTLMFALAYYVIRWRRKLAQKNLSNAFPEKLAGEQQAIERSHFVGLLDTTLESLKGATISIDELRQRIEFENIELLEYLGDQPYFIAGGHQGNWEWQLLALSERLNLPVEAIYAPSPSQALEENLLATRSRFGIHLIPRDNTMIEVAKRLKQRRAIVILSDQNPRRDAEQLWLPFLNQDTAFPVGLDKLARLTKYPIVFQESRRTKRGHYQVSFHLLAEPPYARGGDDIMRNYAQALEQSIHSAPDDWLWSYDRWRYPKPLYG